MKLSSIYLILFVTLSSLAQAQQNEFLFRRKISDVKKADWYSITIPDDAFSKLNRDFSDVRLYSIAGKDTTENPYIIKIKTDDIQEEIIELPVRNKSKKNGVIYMTFELKGGQHVNYLDLKFEQKNFFAFVKVEGSQDQKEWFELANKERILSIHNASADYDVTTVSFPESDYRFLRVSISSDTPLSLASTSFKNQKIKKGSYRTIKSSFNVKQDKKQKQSVVDITLDNYVPVSQIKVLARTKNDFYRQMNIEYVSDSINTPKGWINNYQSLQSGYLTSFTPNDFEFTYELTRKLRLTILNEDNAPLSIDSIEVSGPVVELISNLNPGENFLFYGNKEIGRPSYDLDYFTEKVPANPAIISLEDEVSMANEVKRNPLVESKVWLWVIMGVVIAVLGFFTLRMMKSK